MNPTIARLLIAQPSLLPTLGDWVLNLHPVLLKEIAKMPRTKQLNPKIKPLVEFLGLPEVFRQLNQDQDFEDEERYKTMLAAMTPKQRKVLEKCLHESKEA